MEKTPFYFQSLGIFLLIIWNPVTSSPENPKAMHVPIFPKDAFHNKTIITDHHHLEDELKHEIGDINLDNVSEDELEFYYFTIMFRSHQQTSGSWNYTEQERIFLKSNAINGKLTLENFRHLLVDYNSQVHDFDHNKLLDGLEIMAALQDSLEHYLGDAFSKEDKMKHYIAMTDEVLQEDDLDKDGFLTFVEYMHSQKRTASPTTILDKNAKDKTGSKKSD